MHAYIKTCFLGLAGGRKPFFGRTWWGVVYGAGACFFFMAVGPAPAQDCSWEQVLNESEAAKQAGSRVVVDAVGNVVVGWTETTGQETPTPQYNALLRLFSSDLGIALSSQQQVNMSSVGSSALHGLCAFASGGGAAMWTGHGPGGEQEVYAQVYDSDWVPAGSEFRLDEGLAGQQAWFGPANLACLTDGSLVAAWTRTLDGGSDPNDMTIGFRRFDATGAPLSGEISPTDFTDGHQYYAVVRALPAGGFILAWTSGCHQGSFAPGCAPAGGDLSVSQDGSWAGVFARRFSADGSALEPEWQVNSFSEGTQGGWGSLDLAVDSSGGFAVAWSGNGPGDDMGIFFQRFAADSSRVGAELALNSATRGLQMRPRLAINTEGSVLVAWNSSDGHVVRRKGLPSEAPALMAKRVGADGSLLGRDFMLDGYADGSAIFAKLVSSGSGFVAVWDYNGPGELSCEITDFDRCGEAVVGKAFTAAAPVCGAVPETDCCPLARASVSLGTRPARDKLAWKSEGPASEPAEILPGWGLGSYSVCLYDQGDADLSLASMSIDPCQGDQCWKQGWKRAAHKARGPSSSSNARMRANGRALSKAGVKVKAADLVSGSVAAVVGPVLGQLRGPGGQCWQASMQLNKQTSRQLRATKP